MSKYIINCITFK